MTLTELKATLGTVDAPLAGAINMALAEAMAKDDRVIVLGEDIADPVGGVMKVTTGLSDRFGTSRVRDTPISETAIVGAAIGAAVAGLRPVAEIMLMDFMGLCLDQLVNHAAKIHYTTGGRLSVPMTVRVAVTAGMQAGATHSQSLESWLMHAPGLKIAMPSTAFDAKGMLTTCIHDDDPCVFIENAATYAKTGPVGLAEYFIPVGEADTKRPGTDATIITYGWMLDRCLAAAETLAEDGADVEVLDLRWLVPLDTDRILASVARTRRAVIVHSATRFCGPGAEIAAVIAEELHGQLDAPIGRVGPGYTPIPAAAQLEQAYYPTPAVIVDAVRRALD